MLKISGVTMVLLGVLVLAHCRSLEDGGCPKNEVYDACGSPCPPSCTNLGKERACTELCVIGCACSTGLVRSDNGTCVEPSQCGNVTRCEENEEFTTCIPLCPRTCTQPDPLPCSGVCEVGCTCASPFVRDENGKCIALEDCPTNPCLNENEVYDVCNGDCESTCSDPNPICTAICKGGCVCAPGLIRNDTGDCITLEDCPLATDVDMVTKLINAISTIIRA